MKRMGMIVVTLLLFVAATSGTQELQVLHGSHVWHVVNHKLDVVAAPALSGRATMVLSFTPTDMCGEASEVTLRVETSEGLRYLGPEPWSFPFDTTVAQTATFDIEIPPNDTSSIRIWMDCGRTAEWADKYFVTTGEKLEVWSGHPGHYAGRKKPTPPDTTKYEIRIDLRDTARYAYIKQYEEQLGPLVETPDSGFYRMRVTRESIRGFRMDGFGVELLEEVPGLQVPPPKQDSSGSPKPAPDSAEEQSDVGRSPDLYGSGRLWLDSVGGISSSGKLPIYQVVTFVLGVENNTNCTISGMMNGFKIYSPDGAEWNTTEGGFTGTITYPYMFENQVVNYAGVTGTGADTVGFGLYHVTIGSGLPIGFDNTAFTIEIGPLDPGSYGKTICLDSAFYPPSGVWKWSCLSPCPSFIPSWDGPHCFEVGSWDSLQFTGHLYYLDPVPPDTNPMPMRDVTIEMWDEDNWPDSDDLLDTYITTESGFFDLGPVSNDDIWAEQDVFFRIYAENDAAYVTVAHDGDIHRIQTPHHDDFPGGIYDTTIIAALDDSGPFFVADAVLDSYRKWKSLRSEDIPQVEVVVKADTGSTYYFPEGDYILINDSIDYLNWWPDTWDRDVILHEYGHKIEFSLGFCDDMTGYPGSHVFWGVYNPETAAMEGFAHFWSAIVRDDAVQCNTTNNLYDTSWRDIENGEYGRAGPTYSLTDGSANALGFSNEGAAAGALWDIYDIHDDDYSGRVDWGDKTLPHTPDDTGDVLRDGIDTILIALVERTVNGHHPDNLHEFWDAWFDYVGYSPPLGDGWEMVDIWHEHGVSVDSVCCIGLRGNVDGLGGERVDITDLVYMVDYMFVSGPWPPCMPEADINGDGEPLIDISDLVYLVDLSLIHISEPTRPY